MAADGKVLSLRSDSGQSGQLANGGVYLVNPGVLTSAAWEPSTKLSLEEDILPSLLARGALFFGHVCAGRFIDIGLPEDYFRSASFLTA